MPHGVTAVMLVRWVKTLHLIGEFPGRVKTTLLKQYFSSCLNTNSILPSIFLHLSNLCFNNRYVAAIALLGAKTQGKTCITFKPTQTHFANSAKFLWFTQYFQELPANIRLIVWVRVKNVQLCRATTGVST
jgi:hypothetical protein